MALVINATPKSTTANSYLTRAEANDLLDSRLYASAWTNASDADKDRALVWATALLDSLMDWTGIVTEPGTWNGTEQVGIQALRWPRYPVPNRDGYGYLNKDTVPTIIKLATAELALVLLTSDRFSQPSLLGLGIEEASVGSLSVKVSKDQVVDLIPPNIYAMLSWLGVPISQAQIGGTKTHQLRRV